MLINPINQLKKIGLILVIYISVITAAQAKLVILACEPEWAVLAHEIGKNLVSVTSATHAKQNPHYIEARPSLIAAARKANLVIGTGAELEDGWLPVVLQKANQPKIHKGQMGYLMFSDFIELQNSAASLESSIDRAMGDIHAAGNPHIQLDPRIYLVASKILAERLGQLDVNNAVFYQKNYLAFKQKWENKLRLWAIQAQPLKGMKIVVYHDNWVYLNHWLGLDQVTTLEPKPGVPPSAAYLKTVLLKTQKEKAQVILRTTYDPIEATKWLHQKTGVPVLELAFTVGGNDQSKDLFELFDDIVKQLLLRLNK